MENQLKSAGKLDSLYQRLANPEHSASIPKLSPDSRQAQLFAGLSDDGRFQGLVHWLTSRLNNWS